jgi:hypothetical protein
MHQNEMAVSAETLALLREVALGDLDTVADSLHSDATNGRDIAPSCERMEDAIAVYRALAIDADAYPRTAVTAAAKGVIADAASRVRDDGLSIDEAEALIRRAREMEALVAA